MSHDNVVQLATGRENPIEWLKEMAEMLEETGLDVEHAILVVSDYKGSLHLQSANSLRRDTAVGLLNMAAMQMAFVDADDAS